MRGEIVCRYCDGWGEVELGRCLPGGKQETIRHRRCPNCQGRGTVGPR